MKNLTKKEISALLTLYEQPVPVIGCSIHGKTVMSLFHKELIDCPRYANGEFWELTDNGYKAINK